MHYAISCLSLYKIHILYFYFLVRSPEIGNFYNPLIVLLKDMKVIYIGDKPRDSRYLNAVMHLSKIESEYYYPEEKNRLVQILRNKNSLSKYDVIILSDAPSGNLGEIGMQNIKECVEEGTGLGMIGGWESFTGIEGNYKNTLIEEILPVNCSPKDDRRNVSGGLKIIKIKDHPILEGLPWNDTPTVCGYNIVAPKDDSMTILTLKEIMSYGKNRVEKLELSDQEDPLLVVGKYGKGNVLAFTTDIAPHWVGGLVDWGVKRIRYLEAEIGNYYIKFLSQMLYWLANA